MTTDPELLLREAEPESPPPEIVLAAVRVFRYRALSLVLVVAALASLGFFAVDRITASSRALVRIAEAQYEQGGTTIGEVHEVGDAQVALWEIVYGPTPTLWVHLLAWNADGPALGLEVARASLVGEPVEVVAVSGGGQAGENEVSTQDLWVEIRGAIELRGGLLVIDVALINQSGLSRTPIGTTRFEIDI